ncbi:MAG: VanZ family protein [Cyanobacteriota bacterium]
MKWNRNWVLAFGLYVVFLLTIIILAYLGVFPVKLPTIPFYDTFGHFILLGSASYLGHKALGGQMIKMWPCPLSIPLVPIAISIFAAVDESLQALSPLRTSSWLDMMANLVGIWVFYGLAVWK